MKTMTIQEFTAAGSAELLAFKNYWRHVKYPSLCYDDKHFYDYSANMWDWVDQYDTWKSSLSK